MNKISFPHMGNYYIPVSYLIKNITHQEVIIPPKITKKTIELGSINSPDFVCSPFKYNLGNYIEALEQGANILVQAGGGCRYGYYAELQEKILKDLGYNFKFINLIHNNHISIKKAYKFAKQVNKKLNIFSFTYYLINTVIILLIIDKYEKIIRENKGFEVVKNSFNNLHNKLLNELQEKISLFKLIKINIKYKYLFKKIKINKPPNHLKIGLVGELFSLMEPFSSANIEEKLISHHIEVFRQTTLTYLLITKKFTLHHHIKKSKKYLRFHLGADGSESVYLSHTLKKKGYDGIVHIKSFGCTPEINAIPIMNKISEELSIPIIHFSFDSEDSDVGVTTRIEAFYDMIKERKEQDK